MRHRNETDSLKVFIADAKAAYEDDPENYVGDFQSDLREAEGQLKKLELSK